MKKILSIFLAMMLAVNCLPTMVHAKDYSKYSNTPVFFGLNLRTDHKRPTCEKPKGVKKISKYNTYYYGMDAYKNDEKVIYLTFDCGYENGNTSKILDTLKKEKVKAIFFVTEPYVKDNVKLVKRMKKEGHLVGNHTCNHPRMTSLSVSQMKKEVNQCKKTMEKKTGYTMDPFMRPPEGVYSVRVMKVMQDQGYNTMLWSLAIYDYEEKDQPSVSYVVDKFKKHHFCGMMPLLHVISSADRKALPKIISTMKEKGYRFGTVDEFIESDEKDAAKAAKKTEKDDKKAAKKAAKKTEKDDKKAAKKAAKKTEKDAGKAAKDAEKAAEKKAKKAEKDAGKAAKKAEKKARKATEKKVEKNVKEDTE